MTVIAAHIDDAGCVIVADKRVLSEIGIESDKFTKLSAVGKDDRFVIGIAGNLGPAQVWLRALKKLKPAKLKSVEDVMSEHCGGEFLFILYDRGLHELWSGDGAGCLMQVPSGYQQFIGGGAEYVKGFTHAHGPLEFADAAATFEFAVKSCAEHNVSVSAAVNVLSFAVED